MVTEYKEYGWKEEQTPAHAYLLPTLRSLLNKEKNCCILDVGCGSGFIANLLIAEGFVVYGIDASREGIALANQKNPGHFFVQDITSRELPSELRNIVFDTIISTEVIEHLYDPRGYVAFCRDILLKNGGGEIIISTPYHGYLKNLVMALTGTLDNHFTALWDGGHIKFWSRKTLSLLLEESGFKIVAFRGAGRVPYLWKSMFLKGELQ